MQSADYFRTSCYDLFEYTEDAELLFLAGEDGLDFKENADGDFEAEFTMWRVNYHPGMKVWGWMDAPDGNFDFTTCDPTNGWGTCDAQTPVVETCNGRDDDCDASTPARCSPASARTPSAPPRRRSRSSTTFQWRSDVSTSARRGLRLSLRRL